MLASMEAGDVPTSARDRPIRCVQIIASVADPGAGTSYSVRSLCSELRRRNADVSLLTVDGWRERNITSSASQFPDEVRHQQDHSHWPILSRLCLSAGLRDRLEREAANADVFHGHGLWLMPNVYPSWVAARSRTPVVLSPRGLLGPEALKFSAWRKKAFWRLFQKRAVGLAACLHATSEQEYSDIRAFGITKPVAVIPNGIHLPGLEPRAPLDPRRDRTVLYLGRIHPIKGLDSLLRAWAKVQSSRPDWTLRIAGPDEAGYTQSLRQLARDLSVERVTFDPAVFGPEKTRLYASASLFVLPSLSENFAMTVAESLAAGTPVIATKGTPWPGLAQHHCGWWIENGTDPLAEALAVATAMPTAELGAMGLRGRAWMATDFSWESVGEQMLALYSWLIHKGEPPPMVKLD